MFNVKPLERRTDEHASKHARTHARTAYKLDSEDPINDRFSWNG
jgi:hypothetical protein